MSETALFVRGLKKYLEDGEEALVSHNGNRYAAFLNHYVDYFNTRRRAYALGYKSPIQYKPELGF